MTKQITTPAIAHGIKTVAVGKKGSKSLNHDDCQSIIDEIQTQDYSTMALGAFFGALCVKGLSEEDRLFENHFEKEFFSHPFNLIEHFSPESPSNIKALCRTLLDNQSLNIKETETLGQFLFSEQTNDFLRGLTASILRVRYETLDEYQGLLNSIEKTFHKIFHSKVNLNHTTIQLADPFDGASRTYCITPILAQHLIANQFQVVTLCGESSGPKLGNNLFEIGKQLKVPFIKNPTELNNNLPQSGWYLNEEDLSKPLNSWVTLRKQMIKRPFLATLERLLNPVGAHVIIASAFHPSYGEKMLDICENAGYPNTIIVRNGIEGGIGFSLKRETKVLCSSLKTNKKYERHTFSVNAEKHLNETFKTEEKLDQPSLETNVQLIQEFISKKKTKNYHFDSRAKVTCYGIEEALKWCLA